MEDVKTIATEGVEKVIDRINKAHKRVNSILTWRAYLSIGTGTTSAMVIVFALLTICGFALKDKGIGLMVTYSGMALVLIIIVWILNLFAKKIQKRAKKDTETLRHNCVRLKLISQGYSDILSCLTSPDKVTFLQGPKDGDGKTMIILILQSGKIETGKMGSKEVATMFEPMLE